MGNPYAPKPPGTPAPPREQEPAQSGPPPKGSRRPPRTPVDPEVMRPLARRLMIFALLLLACLVVSTTALPWRMASVAFAVAALVAGATTLRKLRRAKVRGTLVAAVVAGMAVSLTLGLATLAVIPVWDIEMDRQTCMSEALTHSARSGCLADYKDALETFQDSLTR